MMSLSGSTKRIIGLSGLCALLSSASIAGAADGSNTLFSAGMHSDTMPPATNISARSTLDALALDRRYNPNEASLSDYDAWLEQTLEHSRQNSKAAIIVDKASYTLYLIKNGVVHSSYPVELGFNQYDDKRMEGDGCTPEGIYHVEAVKPKGSSSFYKALLISYPNSSDWKDFRRLKESGEIPQDAKIGGLIEIHGKGSGSRPTEGDMNWALGCIALSNDDIDKIFPHVSSGTRITIVKYGMKK